MRSAKLPIRAASSEGQVLDELGRRTLDQRKVFFNAAAAIEHHHNRDWLSVIRKIRDDLGLPVVEQHEIVLRQIRYQMAARVDGRHIDRNSVDTRTKLRSLLRRWNDDGERQGEATKGKTRTAHAEHGSLRRQWHPHSMNFPVRTSNRGSCRAPCPRDRRTRL
jgi:hypothetical protein